jgi:hypothetical protein
MLKNIVECSLPPTFCGDEAVDVSTSSVCQQNLQTVCGMCAHSFVVDNSFCCQHLDWLGCVANLLIFIIAKPDAAHTLIIAIVLGVIGVGIIMGVLFAVRGRRHYSRSHRASSQAQAAAEAEAETSKRYANTDSWRSRGVRMWKAIGAVGLKRQRGNGNNEDGTTPGSRGWGRLVDEEEGNAFTERAGGRTNDVGDNILKSSRLAAGEGYLLGTSKYGGKRDANATNGKGWLVSLGHADAGRVMVDDGGDGDEGPVVDLYFDDDEHHREYQQFDGDASESLGSGSSSMASASTVTISASKSAAQVFSRSVSPSSRRLSVSEARDGGEGGEDVPMDLFSDGHRI